jgi:hypothetical protein
MTAPLVAFTAYDAKHAVEITGEIMPKSTVI